MTARKIVAAVLVALISTCSCLGCGRGYFVRSDEVFAGYVLDVKLRGGNEEGAYEAMKALAGEVDASVSLSLPSSVISRFNAASAGERVKADEHACKLFGLAKDACERTDGAFNPCLSALSEAWGVDNAGITSGKPPENFPTESEARTLGESADISLVSLVEEDGETYLVKSESAVTLDFGGLAKGYIADEARAIAASYGVKSGCVSLSGNVLVFGENESGGEWGVGVVDPRSKFDQICGFYRGGDFSAVTSGDYERFYEAGGVRFCHVLSPFTLAPVGVERTESGFKQSDDYVISATVVGASSATCDALSTAVAALGLERGAGLLERCGYDGIIFTSSGKMRTVGTFKFASSRLGYTEYERV